MKEKWSVGTYIVPLQNRLLSRCETLIAYKPYKIIRNYQIPIIKSENGVEINFCPLGVSVEEREGIRWFETYEEALKFSKKNIYLPDYVECISSELSYIKPGVIYKFECKTDLRSLLLKCNVDSLHTAGTALFASITSFNFKESNELAYNKQKKVITTFPEVWEFKFETEEELKVVGDFITNSIKNGVDYANRSKIGGWVSYPNFGCGRIKGAVRISFEQFKERYITDIPKEDCSKTSERDIFNTNLLNEAKRRYPVGTLFSSAYQGDECIVVELFFKEDKNYGRAIQNSKGGWVYCDGNGWADIKALPKDFVPEYIECIEGSKKSDYITGKIYKVPKDGRIPTESGYIPMNVCVDINDYYVFKFKPSTKEAFDAQNQPKQPLKQAVHCKTQEEWDFVSEKIGYKWDNYSKWSSYLNSTCINLNKLGFGTAGVAYKGYQILSFQEWCDLNGYKMENKCELEVGKWYKLSSKKTKLTNPNWYIKYKGCEDNIIYASEYINNKNIYVGGYRANFGKIDDYKFTLITISEIQQYLPEGHPDKIKSNQEFKIGDWVICIGEKYGNNGKLNQLYKVIEIEYEKYLKYEKSMSLDITQVKIRHATAEEINNYLISIGQIPDYPIRDRSTDDLSNYGLPTEPPSYMYEMELKHSVSKSKLILSINDEELPMVNIIKTNTIKQLLNND